jgi:hypothetical protein
MIMNWKGYVRKWSWLILRYYPGKTKEDFENTQDNWFLGQDMNLENPEYEGEVLTSRTRRLFEDV